MEKRLAFRRGFCGFLTALALVTAGCAAASVHVRAAEHTESTGFILRDCNGRLAVYAAGEKEPVTITEIETASLREHDRALVESGLLLKTQEEVLLLLEDLGS